MVKVGKFVHEMAAIYLTAGIETIMEDLVAKCLEAVGSSSRICSSLLEQTISSNSDYWGLFQPYSHLSSCRTANGLDMPRGLLEYANEARGHPASQVLCDQICTQYGLGVAQDFPVMRGTESVF